MARKKKMRLCASVQKTFEEGFQEFILDCKSRNLRQGTIIHYEVAIKQTTSSSGSAISSSLVIQ